MIRPIGKNILISKKKSSEKVEYGKLFIPKEEVLENFIEAIGNDAKIDAKVGDKIFIRQYNHGVFAYETKDSTFTLITEDDIIGVYHV